MGTFVFLRFTDYIKMLLLAISCVVMGVALSGSEQGLKADGAYCNTEGYEISIYNSYSYERAGCCPTGSALKCNSWDLKTSCGCCDVTKFDFLDCSWLGFGSCSCYHSENDEAQGKPTPYQDPVYRDVKF